MEPITSTLLVLATSAALTTARPKWEPKFSDGANSTEFLEPKKQAGTKVLGSSTTSNFSALGFDTQVHSLTSNKAYPINQDFFPSIYDRVIKELDRYASLPDNWDGEGAVALSSEVRNNAETFINKYPANLPIPSPMLSTEGELSFYWNSDNLYVDLQFDGADLVSLYIHDRNSGEDLFHPPMNINDLSNDWFYITFGAMFVSAKKVA